jgi:hypothetical protein
MLTLSSTQIEKIEASRKREIIEDITDWMIEDYELEAMPRAEVLSEVSVPANEAFSWGLTEYRSVQMHVHLSKALGAAYTVALPFAKAVLADQRLAEDIRSAWLAGWIEALQAETFNG